LVSLFSRKIIKIVVTRCQILRLKCTKFDFKPLWGSLGLQRSLQTPFRGLLLRKREKGRKGERKGKKRGEKRKGIGWEERRGEGNPWASTPPPKKVNFLVESLIKRTLRSINYRAKIDVSVSGHSVLPHNPHR